MRPLSEDPNYRHTDPTEEICGNYVLECTECLWKTTTSEYTSVGWAVGDMVKPGGDDPNYGKCLQCLRTGTLRVVKTPVLPCKTDVPGFTKIPQE
jgi:hypothetical protein